MRNVARHLHIGGLYFLQAIKMRLEYRMDFFVECLASLLQQASGLLMLKFVFDHFHTLNEWSRDEVIFIYGFSLIPMAFFDAFAMSFYMFSDKYIVGGELDRLMLRPLNSLFQLLMEGVSFDFLADLTLGIVVLSYAWQAVGPPVSAIIVLQLLLCIVGAWGVLTGVFLTLTSLSFWSQDRMSIMPPVYNLLNFARYPLDIYRPFVRILLTWVVPFGFVAFYPSSAFLETGSDFREFAYFVPLAGLLMLCLGAAVWKLGTRHYAGAGS
ncbi:MAG TPA: ABC-2 family transporter protein [Planctomycetota bacterium]|nr:ABC-2 family transporter protein [Planctomycetota bacterium]